MATRPNRPLARPRAPTPRVLLLSCRFRSLRPPARMSGSAKITSLAPLNVSPSPAGPRSRDDEQDDQCSPDPRRMGGRLLLGQGHSDLAGAGSECPLRTDPSDLSR